MKKKSRTIASLYAVSLSDIQAAKNELSKYIPSSPLLLNSWLSEQYGCELYLKMENMQPIGSFKIRGATYKISQLSPADRKKGVIAASAGNHAQGVAWGSRKLGIKSLIVMPKTAPLIKVENTRMLGAEVVLEGDNYDEAYAAAQIIAKKTGRVFVHAFDDAQVIAGQGTLGLELLEQLPGVDIVIGSIGGGGLMAGVATALKELRPKTVLIGAQSSGAPSMLESFKKGSVVKLDRVDTFADGIAVKEARENLYRILAPRLSKILVADDESIAAAILTLLEKAKVVSEGAGAVSLACLDQIKKEIRGKKVVVIVGGGNIDVNVLSRVIDRGLIRKGRRLRVNVLISDRPGSLARLTELIARQGANILQAIHDRNEPSITIDKTEVALTLETRGPEHSEEVIAALKSQVLKVTIVH
ncbi:MAG: threonine ammonia-lyase [Methylotenera sp.]|nr:threonine ammonia-lyase [Oligoflexia bacterium]